MIEKRVTPAPIELRTDSGARRIGGHAVVFDVLSQPLGGFVERVDRRALNKSAGDGFPNVVARFNHEDNFLLGTTRSGTLRLALESTGLLYEVDLPLCRNDIYELTERGDLAHSSFAFQAYEDDWSYENGAPLRTLLSVRLIDVAPVVNPAYPDATVGLRSLARHVGAPVADVVDLAERGELRKLFVRRSEGCARSRRTDNRNASAAGRFGPMAMLEILARRADDPIGKIA
jgi:HK97 family phage prohead protease